MTRTVKRLDRVMRLIGTEWCGSVHMPRDHRSLYIDDEGVTRVFVTSNDGADVGIGYPDEWQVFVRWKAARLFAWWVLRIHVADWFGFRTWLYKVALHRSVRGEWRWRWPAVATRRSSYDEWVRTEGNATTTQEARP